MKLLYIYLLFLVVPDLLARDPSFNIGGKPYLVRSYRIVMPVAASAAETKAATELRKYLEIITGVKLDLVHEGLNRDSCEIIIGHSNRFPVSSGNKELDPDGFEIRIHQQDIIIAGGSHKGTLYGVYEFLENFAGCRFWAPGAETIPKLQEILLPVFDTVMKPAFQSREVYYAGMDDQDFADKMRSDRHAWKGGENWGLWVHTMFTLVPPEKYFSTHPEFYALMGGKRARTQLCLTNPDVLKVTVDELKLRMNKKPGAKYWSVSQMDTYGSCECDACRAIDDHEGSASGTMIHFVNRVAAEFPGKVISTLAYQYTRKAPKHVKPASNVNIMLCTIECDRSRPLESDASAGSFADDLRNWSAIAGDILVWDYVIQFTNMTSPFPNLQVLQPNIQMFRKYGVGSVFEQGCHGTYSENQELRQFLLAKLLWNPDLNVDSLTGLFLRGYYGAAGQYIGEYLHGMTEALNRSGKTLWIYGSPMQETDAFLGPENIREYQMLFARAEKSVEGDPALTDRVIKAGLPLRYAILEIAKKNITGPDGFMVPGQEKMVLLPGITDQLSDFVKLAKKHGVKTLHERSLPPGEYGKITSSFFQNAFVEHIALGKPYSLDIQPSPKYSAEGPGTLTDGKRGLPNYYVLWQGFEEVDLTAVIDLGTATEINYVGAGFLQDHASWIFYPEKLVISLSLDGTEFRTVAVFDSLSFKDPLLIRETGEVIAPVSARYVKYYARNTGKCPDWHIGHGGKAWLFADELIADRR